MAINRAPQGYEVLYLIQDASGVDLDPAYAVPLYGWDDLGDPYILLTTTGRLRVADSDAALSYVAAKAGGASASMTGIREPTSYDPGSLDLNATPATNPNA